MRATLALLAAMAACIVNASPAPMIKRSPSPALLYASDVALPTSPAQHAKRTVNECQVVNAVVGALKAVSSVAYPFCSTYISIPVVTSTQTSTTTVTPSPVHVVSTITPAAATVTITTSIDFTVTGSTSTIYSHYTPSAAAKEKRAAPTLPPYLSKFAASQVSQACSCLSIPAKTTTVSTVATSSLPASTITSTVTAATPTATVTSTSTLTVAQSTTTLPAICAPSVLAITSGVLSSGGNTFPNELNPSASTVIDCCVACFETQNCLSYLFTNTCNIFVLTVGPNGDPAQESAAQQALCPVGISTEDTINPPGVTSEGGPDGFHVGPCIIDAVPYL